MRKTNVVILFFVLSIEVIKAQTFSIGTGFGANILMFDKGVESGLTLNLSGNLSFSRMLEAEIRPGISMAPNNFNGVECGGYLMIFPLKVLVYSILGLKLHSNVGAGGISHQVRDDLYMFPTLEIGFRPKVQKTLVSFEILYQKPYPNGLTYSVVANQYYYSDDFNGIVS
jgi:hypothetical protein